MIVLIGIVAISIVTGIAFVDIVNQINKIKDVE